MSDDIIEQMARAMYENRQGLNVPWKEAAVHIKGVYMDDARAAIAIALEEAAKVAEGMYQHGQIGSDIAAAIRKLKGEA